jgi:hypothetical protein
VLRISVNYFPTIDALLKSERLSESEALDQRKVEAALAEIICEWSKKWRDA